MNAPRIRSKDQAVLTGGVDRIRIGAGPKNAVCALAAFCCLLMASCMPSPYYQKNQSIPQNTWSYDHQPSFRVAISDTTVYYTMYFLIRHTDAYPYANLWLRIYSQQPGDTTEDTTRIEVTLAAPSGQWLGRGMGTIWEHRAIISGQRDRKLFARPGTYTFRFEQDMRINPLPEVLQVGLRVEKGGAKEPLPSPPPQSGAAANP